MKSRLLLCATFLLAALALRAQKSDDARVIMKRGTAQIALPGGSGYTTLEINATVPVGSKIKIGPASELFLETFPGAVATLKENTLVTIEALKITREGEKVTSQDALLDLQEGNIVSTLNPRMKDVNHYGVKTPRGIAAARGTVFGVSVIPTAGGGSNTSVATLSGIVRIDLGGGKFLDIPYGTASANGAAAQALQAAIASGAASASDVADAVRFVAENVKASTSAVDSSDSAIATMAAVVSAASAALPAQASSFTQTAVAAISSSTSASGKDAAATAKAVAAITEAAVTAAPAAATDIAKTAAATVVETKVTEAIQKAKADGTDTTAAATAAAATAQSSVQAAAQGAVNGAKNSGSTTDSKTLLAAVNQGSTDATQKSATQGGATVPQAPLATLPTAASSTAINNGGTTVVLPPLDQTQPVISTSKP